MAKNYKETTTQAAVLRTKHKNIEFLVQYQGSPTGTFCRTDRREYSDCPAGF